MKYAVGLCYSGLWLFCLVSVEDVGRSGTPETLEGGFEIPPSSEEEHMFSDITKEDVFEAWGRIHTWRDNVHQLRLWMRAYEYQWHGKRIVHPLSVDETRARHAQTLSMYVWLTAQHRFEQENT